MLANIDLKGIVSHVEKKIDEWDSMTTKQRAKVKIDRESSEYRFWADNQSARDTMMNVLRQKRFKGLKVIKTEGSVTGRQCIAALGSKNKVPKRVGRGAYGEVFEHPKDPKRILKIISDYRGDPDTSLREAEITKKASQLGVAPKFHGMSVCCGTQELKSKRCMLILEMASLKMPLHEWISKKERSKAEKEKMLDKIEALLKKLHGAGIKHNDIHGGNVMIDGKGQPFIIDFGLATDSANQTALKVRPGLEKENATWIANDMDHRIIREFRDEEMNDMMDFLVDSIAKETKIS